jgi:hypothetical protein
MQVTHVETWSEETPRPQLSKYTGTHASYALHIYVKKGKARALGGLRNA